jgi:hypothetical protein
MSCTARDSIVVAEDAAHVVVGRDVQRIGLLLEDIPAANLPNAVPENLEQTDTGIVGRARLEAAGREIGFIILTIKETRISARGRDCAERQENRED